MRKKGSIIIEFLAVIPIFMLLVWGIVQAMLYMSVHSTLHEAAVESARILAVEMRGQAGGFPDDADTIEELESKLENKTKVITNFNRFIMLYYDNAGNELNPDIILIPGVTNQGDPDPCIAAMSGKTEAICAYTAKYGVSGPDGIRDHEQIVVKISSRFYVAGSFIPGFKDVKVDAMGVAHKELPDRFQYIPPNEKRYGEESP